MQLIVFSGLPGTALKWADLLQTKARYTTWQEERLIIDAMHTLTDNIALILAYLEARL